MKLQELKVFLDKKSEAYNHPSFIHNDPIAVPHRFTLKQDIEIAGLFAAILAWGQRKTIIHNANQLMHLMDMAPHQFILEHQPNDLQRFNGFVHRTFNDTDLLYVIDFLKRHYTQHQTLEDAFIPVERKSTELIYDALSVFHKRLFNSSYAPQRTKKHFATPERQSACKRLNMYLRWMVRHDDRGVDFGLWTRIRPYDLICPLDLHVQRVALKLKLISRDTNDWQAAMDVTRVLRMMRPHDPVYYDYALFGLGVMEKWR
ncbi:MAG: TIGR02757 family protein [Bacteroidetes bacterium]|nr:TIGR02757 family protein [Bacteroidota bacterium]